MKCPSLSQVILIVLKSPLSDVIIIHSDFHGISCGFSVASI